MQQQTVSGVEAHASVAAHRHVDGAVTDFEETLAEETPIALVYNGISHAVMLATPLQLEDFAIGFSLSERIVVRAGQIHDLEIVERDNGIELQMQLAGERLQALKAQRRSAAGRTGCGLCGKESLDQLMPRAPRVQRACAIAPGAIEQAVADLQCRQLLFGLTGAVHAAAWCDASGRIGLLREDVGRHNALDKLIGALAARPQGVDDGFVLITSRASYEIVHKAAAVGIAVIAAVSAPTALAVRSAIDAGITLVGFVRGRRYCVYAHPGRVRQAQG